MNFWRTAIMVDGPDALCVTVRGLRRLRVTETASLSVPGHAPEALAEMIRTALDRSRLRHGQIRLILPAELCENYLRMLATPLPSDAVYGDSLRWLEEECGLDPQAYDVRVNATIINNRQVLSISTLDRGALARCRQACEAAGLHNVVMVSPLDAMIQMATVVQTPTKAPNRALIHVGRAATMVLVVENGLPVFFRNLPKAVQCAPTDAGADSLSPQYVLTNDELNVLSEELVRTLQYYQQTLGTEEGEDEIILSSTNLELSGLASVLHRQTGAACNLAASRQITLTAEDANALTQQRALAPLSMAMLQKVPASRRLAATPPRSAQIAAGGSFAAAVTLVFAVLLLTYVLALMGRNSRLSGELARLDAEEAKLRQGIVQRQEQHLSRRSYRRNSHLLLQLKQQGVLMADMLVVANNLRPDPIKFQQMSLESGSRQVTLRIQGAIPQLEPHEALRLLDEYAAALRATPVIGTTWIQEPALRGPGGEDVSLDRQRAPQAAPTEPVVTFTLVAQTAAPWQLEGP